MEKEDNVKKKTREEMRKPMLTLFILLFPILILAYTAIIIVDDTIPMLVLKLSLFFYEAIILKNFVDDHYRYKY